VTIKVIQLVIDTCNLWT